MSESKKLTPPEIVRGMKTLDKSAFKRDIQVLGLKVPASSVASVNKKLKTSLFKIPGIRPIAELSETDPDFTSHKLFLFDPLKFGSAEDFDSNEREFLCKESVDLKSSKLYDLTLTYENWAYDEILDAVLPEDTGSVGGFSIIGHIAHLNLRENLLEYKNIIGEVLLDKISTVKTVVNKVNVIDNTFRNFQMEVLCGEENFVTVAKEHGFSYEFDFSKVYWNSRLSTEHQRIVSLLNKGDIVYDMFAGVGPFAIPAAKKKCIVYANDLNPESYRWLQHNAKLNKVTGEIHSFNMDGREFIKSVFKKSILELWSRDSDAQKFSNIHVIMNLPAIAVEFLDVFHGLLTAEDLEDTKRTLIMPTIHCYCFSKGENTEEEGRLRVETVLGQKLPDDHSVRLVRNVAPNKEMLCISFVMPEEILIEKGCMSEEDMTEPEAKKCKMESTSQS